MRAVTGTILATKPCSVVKAARILELFAGSDVLSSDAATYLHTAIEAADELNLFRRDLRRRQLQEGGGGSEIKRTHRPAPVNEEGRWEPKVEEEFGRWEPKVEEEEYGRWEPKVEEENEEEYGMAVPAAGEKKNSGKMKGSREEKQDMAAVNGDLQSPASEKRRKKKKEKHAKEDDETGDGIGAQSRKALDDAFRAFVSGEGISSEKKAKKKKKHIKQEEELMRVKEVEQEMVHAGVAENGLASEEKKRKKRKHTEEEEVKKEVADGDLGSDKKRKKKRGRDGDNGNDTELVEHKQKKQRK